MADCLDDPGLDRVFECKQEIATTGVALRLGEVGMNDGTVGGVDFCEDTVNTAGLVDSVGIRFNEYHVPRRVPEVEGRNTNPVVTEIVKVAGRGHSLTIDAGWKDVADTALAFVQRFVKPGTVAAS